MMNNNIHRQWGEKDMLFYCPENKVVWQYDNVGNIHIYKDMPTYGLRRRQITNWE